MSDYIQTLIDLVGIERAMKNVVAFGPLLPGRELTEHEPDEYAYIEDLHLLRKIYTAALESIQ